MNVKSRDCRERFAETASTYRKRGLQLDFIAVALMVLFWYLGAEFLAVLTGFVLVGVMVYSKRSLPQLICPACELNAECEFVRFCPQCGSEAVQTKEDQYFLEWPRCQACGGALGTRKGQRLYKIKFCTRCGAYLDEEGV